ncbi:MAG: exo-alpha-sialidase [Phycisphaerae bacterium]|nr:exo-alpha-sialidase [Phycisphaerae bacterium]
MMRQLCMTVLTMCAASATAETLDKDDAALVAPKVQLNPGPEYAGVARLWQGIPGIERAPGGRLWATWYSGGKGEGNENFVVLVTSADDGKTWSPPKIAIDPPGPVRAFDPCLWIDPTGRMWLFWAQSYTLFDGRAGVWAITTTDPGSETPTWTEPRRIANGIMMNKPTVLSDGSWALPTAVWDMKAFRDDMKDQRFPNITITRDQGKTFQLIRGPEIPGRKVDEHMLVQRKDGSWWMLVRMPYGIAETTSRDGGKTWTPPVKSKIQGPNARFFIRRLKSGKLLLVNHYKFKGRSHMTASLSDDDGKTWYGHLLLDERTYVSYPDGVEAPDGRIYITYDRSRGGAKEILMAVVTEEDVAAGKCVGKNARLKVVIDNAGRDASLIAPKVQTNPGPEYAAKNRLWQGIPGIERAAGGRLWALWYSGGKGEGNENYVVAITSGDDGKTWSPPKVVIDPPGRVRAYDPCLWHDPTGRLWLFWAQSDTWFDGRSGTWAITTTNSGHEDPKWSEPRRIADGIMMNKPTALSTGEWALPIAVWNHKPFRDDTAKERFSNLYLTSDQGKTFTFVRGPDVPKRTYDEHMLVEKKDGSWWVLVRTSYGIGQSFSKDRGKTWSPGEDSGIKGPSSRFFIRRLKSGKLLLVNHYNYTGRSHMTASLSDDDGKTWTHHLLLDERKNVSYPDGVQAPDGRVYVIYDRERTKDKEILMAVFTEQDVAAEKCVSDAARLRVLVNKAGQ